MSEKSGNGGNIADLQQRVINYRDARDWEQFHNPKDVAISLALEAAEVLEHFQWKTPEEIEAHLTKNKGELSEELIDVLYWILLLAHDQDIDLVEAFEKKMSQNEVKYPVDKAKGNHKKYTELE